MPEASMSDAKSQELFDYIRDRFHGNESEDLRYARESILSGDRTSSDHMLSKRMMQWGADRSVQHPYFGRDDLFEVYREWRKIFNQYDPPLM